MKTLEFIYQETQIHFLVNPTDKNVMINATEMAKLFNKRIDDFTRLSSTENFIAVLMEDLNRRNNHADVRDYTRNEIINSHKKRGTYMHEILALKFAAWLDPNFEIWVFSTIKDLIAKETKVVKGASSLLAEKEAALGRIVRDIRESENEEAKSLLKAFSEFEAAKRTRQKAILLFSKQMKMDL